jgi:cyclophilin family peptidyl-prolyl cis-trans isomerase
MHTNIRSLHAPLGLIQFLLLLVLMSSSSKLFAQLSVDRLYFGVGQRVVIFVEAPEDFFGDLTIKLHDPQTREVINSAPAAKGRTDLTSLFPMIWADKSENVLLAQLYQENKAVGAPLVIQPIVTPNIATRVEPNSLRVSEDDDAVVVFEDDRLSSRYAKNEIDSIEREKVYSGLRIYKDQEVVMQTSMGEIVFRMRADAAPNTAFNFLHLVEGGFYTNVIFHRIIAKLDDGRPFLIQVGDPSGTGLGGPGYMIDLEKTTLVHDFGVLSMARSADPNTNGSQVFVCLSREGTSFLDGSYTAFAQAVSGADVIRNIAAVQVDANDRPIDPPMIERATTRDAPALTDQSAPLSSQKVDDDATKNLSPVVDR